jgi:uroporphyrinogen-III synthase
LSAPPPLAGFTVGVTAARRREELSALLERRGARIVGAPAIRIVPLADDTELRAATDACLDTPLDAVVVTTGIGFRGWMEAADGWGLGECLAGALRGARILARGPKARGAIRAAGLVDDWSPESESSSEVLAYLLGGGVAGLRIAVQLHGEPLPDFVAALSTAGAQVVQVPVYRWVPPEDVAPLHRLIELVAGRQLDAVAFTSAPAAVSLLTTAAELGRFDAMRDAMRWDVLAACVGPVTAAPLERADIPTVQPARSRLGALVRVIVDDLPARSRILPVAGSALQLRGHAVVLGGVLRQLPPGPLAVLRALARHPGVVLDRAALLAAMDCESGGGHAVEMAVARLRAVLGPRVVQTVVKRGYRLAYEPEALAEGCLSRAGTSMLDGSQWTRMPRRSRP